MRIRTFLGILLAAIVVLTASYLSHRNVELLSQQFRVTPTLAVPVWTVLLIVFLAGFLPAVTTALVQTLRRELARRRERRLTREARSLQGASRRAVDLQADGQWSRAAAELELVLTEQPEDFATLLRYGEVLRRQGRSDEAIEVHRRAAVLYPQSVAVLYQLAEDYEVRGEEAVAREIRDRVLRDFGGFGLQILRRRRNAAIGHRDWRLAAQLQERLEGLLHETGESAALDRETGVRTGLSYQKGVELLEADQVDEAVLVFRQLLERVPSFIPASIMLGEAELLRDRESEALAEWRRGHAATGSPVFLERIEDHFIEREQPVKAIETLHALMAGAADDLLPRFFLGRLYHRLEMNQEALRVLEGLADRIGSAPAYHLLLARIHERRGNTLAAARAYDRCVEQAGVSLNRYRCRVCRSGFGEWLDRCETCGSWDSLALDFEVASLPAEELKAPSAPVWLPRGAGEESSR